MLLRTGLEVLDGIWSCLPRAEKVMQLIHGTDISGQEASALQCLHGGSPLEELKAMSYLFQSCAKHAIWLRNCTNQNLT